MTTDNSILEQAWTKASELASKFLAAEKSEEIAHRLGMFQNMLTLALCCAKYSTKIKLEKLLDKTYQ